MIKIKCNVLKSLFILCFSLFLCTTTVLAQGISVSGTVSCDDNPMIGITVRVKVTTNSVLTNINGEFQINVPNPDAVLLFSFPGYHTVEVIVGDQRTLAVEMRRNDEPSDIDMVKLHAQGDEVTKALADIQSQVDGIMSAIGGETNQIRSNAYEQAAKVRSEANAAADKILSAASNAVAKRAAQPAADKTRNEGEKAASIIEQEADKQIENVILPAQTKADQIKVVTFLQIQKISDI